MRTRRFYLAGLCAAALVAAGCRVRPERPPRPAPAEEPEEAPAEAPAEVRPEPQPAEVPAPPAPAEPVEATPELAARPAPPAPAPPARGIYRDYEYSFSDDRVRVAQLLENARARGPSDDELLEQVSRAAFEYFWNEADPDTGFIRDATDNASASSAATGFGLAAICVADYRGWVTREEAYARVLKTLRAMLSDPGWERLHGFFYHWVNAKTGRWTGAEGMCLHDHVALACGLLTVREYFKGTEAADLADRLFRLADWTFLTHAGENTSSAREGLLSNVSTPDNPDWGAVTEYDGMKLDYLLPIGALESNVDPSYWDHWAWRYPWTTYRNRYFRIARAALWIHQWDNCFLDLFCLRDAYADYFQNSVENTLANRQWCIDHGMYDAEAWGLNPTTGPNPKGRGTVYGDYGAPPAPKGSWQQGHAQDGTIAFTAAIPSIIFTPRESLLVLRYLWNRLRGKMWGKYGFTTSFNLRKNWYSSNYIGIDLGPVVLNIENYRSGLIWKCFMRCPEVKRALHLAGFVGIVDNFDPMEHSPPYARWSVTAGVATLRAVSGTALELHHCLEVAPVGGAGVRFAARPMRRDFSFHSMLGVYYAGGGTTVPFDVALTDGAGCAVRLEPASQGPVAEASGWKLFSWRIPSGGAVDLEDIRELTFVLRRGASRAPFRLDYMCLFDEDAPGTGRPRRVLSR